LARLKNQVEKVRSKNAGPFWVTIDVFCRQDGSFQEIADALSNSRMSELFDVECSDLKRFELPDLHVIKFSVPRPQVQGTRDDRDMHGAAMAILLEEYELGT